MNNFAATSKNVEKLFELLYGFVENKASVEPIWDHYLQSKTGADPEREKSYLKTYVELENFLLSNNPPVTRQAFSKESLQQTILMGVETASLPATFQVFLATKTEKDLAIFEVATSGLAEQLGQALGEVRVGELISGVMGGLAVKDTKSLREAIRVMSQAEISKILKAGYQVLYDEAVKTLGAAPVLAEVSDKFELIRENYGQVEVMIFFEFLPEGIMTDQRVAYASREQLEKQITAAVAGEKKKVVEANILSGQLRDFVVKLEDQRSRLERLNKVMVGRELRMRELKAENEELKLKLGKQGGVI